MTTGQISRAEMRKLVLRQAISCAEGMGDYLLAARMEAEHGSRRAAAAWYEWLSEWELAGEQYLVEGMIERESYGAMRCGGMRR